MTPVIDALALTLIPGVGPAHRRALLEHLGPTPAAVLDAGPAIAREGGCGLPAPAVAALRDPAALRARARREADAVRARGLSLLTPDDAAWPALLHEIADPPAVLTMRGGLDRERDALCVAIVGARRASGYGLRVAERIAADLAGAGVTVVSGLARGIDAAAHRAALAAGGRTVAVLGSGLSRIYPPEHAALADAIAERGALLSELPLDAPPLKHHFPIRNRIVAGMCAAVVVVEARERSGALITARLALEAGRGVLAVPGPIDDARFAGGLALLADGATLCRGAADVLETVAPMRALAAEADASRADAPPPAPSGLPGSDAEAELAVQELLTRSVPLHVDELARRSGIDEHRVAGALLTLQLAGRVRDAGADTFVLA